MWKEGNDFGFLKIVLELKEESDSECHKNELNEDGSTKHDSNPMHDSETDIVIKCEPYLNYSSEDEEFISGSMIDQSSTDESLEDEVEIDDEKVIIVMQNKKKFMSDNGNKETERGSTKFINNTNNEGSSKIHSHVSVNHDENKDASEDDELDDIGYDSPLSADEVELRKPLKT